MKNTTTHHTLDVFPEQEDSKPLFVNEPWLIDDSMLDLYGFGRRTSDIGIQSDNVRIYVPLDLNKEAILRRLRYVINYYGEASEENEADFSVEVDQIISQIEIYDQVCYARGSRNDVTEKEPAAGHSKEAVTLVEEFIKELEAIPDACAECFPFETIDSLREEYLGK